MTHGKISMGLFCFKFILSSLCILKTSRKGIEVNEMRKKSQWLLSTTLFISLGLAACESQSVLSQAYVNTQTTTKTSSNSTTATVSKQAANTGGRPGEGGPGGR